MKTITINNNLFLESARKLLALQALFLAVGHGRVLSNPSDAMERDLAEESGKQAKAA